MIRKATVCTVMLLALAAILVSCSADALVKSSQNMESMKTAGMGKAGNSVVDDAVAAVEGFVKDSEACILWPDVIFDEEGKAEDMLVFLTDEEPGGVPGEKNYLALIRSTVSAITKATETGASDEKLRNALSARYPENGKTYHDESGEIKTVFRRFGDVINGTNSLQSLVDVIPSFISDPEASAAVTASMDNMRNYVVPIPLQTYDIHLAANKAITLVSGIMSFVDYYKTKPKPEPGSDSKPGFDLSLLAKQLEAIASHTGERTYQTVGDKISVCVIYDILDTVSVVLDRYEKEFKDDYGKLSVEWVFKSCGDQVDRLVSDLNVIAYINGIHLDAAGIIGSYVSKL